MKYNRVKSRLRRRAFKRKAKAFRRRPRLYENTFSFRRAGALIRFTQTGLKTITITDPGTYLTVNPTTDDSMTNTIQWGTAFQFKLNQILQSTEFTSLFDRYKINAIKLRILYQASDASTGGLSVLPIINYCHDYDDDAFLASLTALMAKQKSKSTILSANKPMDIWIRPKVPTAIQWGSTGLTTLGLGVSKPMYINSSYPDAPHFGFKMWINNFYCPTGANNQLTIQPHFYVSCKDPQ